MLLRSLVSAPIGVRCRHPLMPRGNISVMRFQDQVVIVTGASRGIGKTLALAFAAEDGFWKQFRKPKIILVQDQNDTLYMIGNISAGSRAKDGNIKCSPINSRDVTLECATPYAPFVMAWDTVISNHSSMGDFSDDFMNQDYD